MPRDPRTIRQRRGAVALQSALLLTSFAVLWWLGASTERLQRAAVSVVFGAEAPTRPPSGRAVSVRIREQQAVANVADEYVSFALDTSQVVGGHWWGETAEVEWPKGEARTAELDFERPGLVELARALAPAYLRIGGTEADSVYYAEGDELTPPGYALRLSHAQWDALVRFARETGNQLMFTLNAGPGPRDEHGVWQGAQAERLMRRAAAQNAPVAVWELGNEVNAFWITHGPWNAPGAVQYGYDVRALRRLSSHHTPQARIAGPGLVVWPRLGEPPPRRLDDFVEATGDALDILTWHYYPQQSRRCPVATRRASAAALLSPAALDEVAGWGAEVEAARDRAAPGAEVWLGETGGAQCGGEPGHSDRFASSLWWLDQLGLLARRGQPVSVRQTLVGSHYGLLDDGTLEPRPDYYASVFFKRWMGRRVLDVETSADDPRVRVYAHCTPAEASAPPGAVSVLAVYLGEDEPAALSLNTDATRAERFELRGAAGAGLSSTSVQLNGHALGREALRQPPRGELLELSGAGAELGLAPLSYTFLVLHDAGAPACL